MVGLVCSRCGRHGQYLKATLLERYGPQSLTRHCEERSDEAIQNSGRAM